MDLTTLGPWRALLEQELARPYFAELAARVAGARAAGPVYPPPAETLRAFALTPPAAVRAVILGQDPYHGPGQANGLAFSVGRGVPLPPSLKNIFKELEDDLSCPPPADGDLSGWAAQGVLLLNTSLTVAEGKAGSHGAFGWGRFTDAAVAAIRTLPQPVVFVLWGGHARKKAAAAADSPHPRLILQAPHPSPLSAYRGFFGSRPFSAVNGFLAAHGEASIDFSR